MPDSGLVPALVSQIMPQFELRPVLAEGGSFGVGRVGGGAQQPRRGPIGISCLRLVSVPERTGPSDAQVATSRLRDRAAGPAGVPNTRCGRPVATRRHERCSTWCSLYDVKRSARRKDTRAHTQDGGQGPSGGGRDAIGSASNAQRPVASPGRAAGLRPCQGENEQTLGVLLQRWAQHRYGRGPGRRPLVWNLRHAAEGWGVLATAGRSGDVAGSRPDAADSD